MIPDERLAALHAYTRKHSVNWPLYAFIRLLFVPFFLVYFRLSRTGRAHARHVKGGLIVAANHRSFLDPFVVGACLPWHRPMNYVAKVELFQKPLQAWFLSRLGAFPIRRGESDEDSMETARMVVERGGTLCIFPEGTRIRRGSLANPKRGVGRLALQTGAPVLPTAVIGTEGVRRGWRIRPRKVKVRLGKAMTFPRAEEPSQALAVTVTSRIWPNVQLQWEDLGGLPPMRRAAVIGAGSWGTAIAVLLARGGLEVQLGARTPQQAAALIEEGENRRYLPAVPLPESVDIRTAAQIELTGVDLIILAIPSKSLPAAVGSIADRAGERSSILLLTKGLVAPQGQLPSEYVGERVRSRAIACLGGPAHAAEAVSGSAALVLGSADPDLRAQLGEVFDRAGLVCERSGDVVGVEMAGAAKNAAALAAAAAEPHGLNAAGIAVAEIWRECIAYGIAHGAEPETFAGLAGVGDLTASMLAPTGRNRRAGELLGAGTPAEEIPALIGQASEGLDTTPLLADAVAAAGVEGDALEGLAKLIRGEVGAEDWVAGLRRAERARQAA
ncbi:MAG: 1-acyl-sn-glycerol-3-phosphate acyltransferase [Actinobacteria bacterium]|nr:1-acyl-sn-glycerol-3-phosphate acyltransferase [Actinomycetota bacterium]